MPKMSYADEVAALEETLAALQVRAEVVPPLALEVGVELAAQIAELKRLKERQRAYAAERAAATEAIEDVIARGMTAARDIRACAVLLYGPQNRQLTQFGIAIRRRPRRKRGSSAAVPEAAPETARNESRTARAARAESAAVGGGGQEVGAKIPEARGEAGRLGAEAPGVGGNTADVREKAPGVRALADRDGVPEPGDRGGDLETRGKARPVGAILLSDRRARPGSRSRAGRGRRPRRSSVHTREAGPASGG